jgi:hypothetical protein
MTNETIGVRGFESHPPHLKFKHILSLFRLNRPIWDVVCGHVRVKN